MDKSLKLFRKHIDFKINLLKLSRKQGHLLGEYLDHEELERDFMDDKISLKELNDYVDERIEYHKFKI